MWATSRTASRRGGAPNQRGVNVERDLISRVTDAVMDDVPEWAKRPLEDIYPVVCLDCIWC